MTTVFSAYVTTSGQAWADFDIYMRSGGLRTRAAARCRIPGDLGGDQPELRPRSFRG